MSASEAAPPSTDPVRLAFARIEGWKAAFLLAMVVGLLVPPTGRVNHHSKDWFSQFSTQFDWRSLGRGSTFGAMLPWIVVKAFAAHLLLAAWFLRRRLARLSATAVFLFWAASTGLDALVLWGGADAVWVHSSQIGHPFACTPFYDRYIFEFLLTPRLLLFVEAWLAVAIAGSALAPYSLYRGMRARAQAEVAGKEPVPGHTRVGGRAVRMALLVGALVLFLALPWTSTRHFTTWWSELPVPDRAHGFVFLFGDEGRGQRDGASLMTIAFVALIGLAWVARPRVSPRGWPARLAVLGAEAACLLAWGVGYALLAFPPLEWLGPARLQRVTEVAPFLNAQLLALCLLESLWFCVRRRPTEAHG